MLWVNMMLVSIVLRDIWIIRLLYSQYIGNLFLIGILAIVSLENYFKKEREIKYWLWSSPQISDVCGNILFIISVTSCIIGF